MRLTRDNLQYWKNNLKPGDLIEFDIPYEESKQALVVEVHKGYKVHNDISVEHDSYDKITRGVQWKKIISIWSKEENPEMFL